MEFKQEGQSEWDGRQAFLERLHKTILQCYEALYTNNYEHWYKALSVLKIELSAHLRSDAEKTLVKTSMEDIRRRIYTASNSIEKFEAFMKAQEDLHSIMRARGFDVPIQDYNPGQVLR